jgi:hypothetical protein
MLAAVVLLNSVLLNRKDTVVHMVNRWLLSLACSIWQTNTRGVQLRFLETLVAARLN